MVETKPNPFPMGDPVPIVDTDYAAIFSGPAFLSNKIFATMTGAGMRLSFMEQHGDLVGPQLRAAVYLDIADAFALRDLLIRQLENVQVIVERAPNKPAGKDGKQT